MTVQELADSGLFALENEGDTMEREITKCFCCDLLSVAMGRAPAGCAWVTVMGNMNTLALLWRTRPVSLWRREFL